MEERIRKTGRPEVEDQRRFQAKTLLNSEEKKQFDSILKASIYSNTSEMIRDIILKKQYKVITVDENLKQEKAVILTQIRKIGVNFNSLLKMLNSKKLNYFTQDDIKNIKNNLESIRFFYSEIKSNL